MPNEKLKNIIRGTIIFKYIKYFHFLLFIIRLICFPGVILVALEPGSTPGDQWNKSVKKRSSCFPSLLSGNHQKYFELTFKQQFRSYRWTINIKE